MHKAMTQSAILGQFKKEACSPKITFDTEDLLGFRPYDFQFCEFIS